MQIAITDDVSQALNYISAMYMQGHVNEALQHYKELSLNHPRNPTILGNIGVIYLQQNRPEAGVELLKESLELDASNAVNWSNLAGGYRALKKFDKAEQCYQKALDLTPENASVITQLAALYVLINDYEAAHAQYKKAITLTPSDANLYFYDGVALKFLKRLDEAVLRFKTCTKLDPTILSAYAEGGQVLIDGYKNTEAHEWYTQAVQAHPQQPIFYFYLGLIAQRAEQFKVALAHYDQAIALNTKYVAALNNRGLVLSALKRYQEALASFDLSIGLSPDDATTYNNRGETLRAMQLHDEAIIHFEKAIELNPNYGGAYNNLGITKMELAEDGEATDLFERALKINPNDAYAQFNLAVLKLRLGNYAQGWPLYESRWHTLADHNRKPFDAPLWLGGVSLLNKTLLVQAEQGLGDTIQFCRYIPLLKQFKPNQIVVEVQDSLFELLNHTWANDPQIIVVTTGSALPHVDAQCPTMSLPLAFKTTLDNIPSATEYLTVDKRRLKYWKNQLAPTQTKRVGLAWSGAIAHPNDIQRSIPLKQLEQLCDINLEWHCLQKEIRSLDRFALRRIKHIKLHQEALNNFSDTAALIMQLDLVISVDTSVAHLAAALGKPVWLLLPFNSDFRWLSEREDSPWYPTVTLFRQPEFADYSKVIDRVEERLLRSISVSNTNFLPNPT